MQKYALKTPDKFSGRIDWLRHRVSERGADECLWEQQLFIASKHLEERKTTVEAVIR